MMAIIRWERIWIYLRKSCNSFYQVQSLSITGDEVYSKGYARTGLSFKVDRFLKLNQGKTEFLLIGNEGNGANITMFPTELFDVKTYPVKSA